MGKADQDLTLLHPQNMGFITGRTSAPINQMEIYKNIAYRLGAIYPSSKHKKAIYIGTICIRGGIALFCVFIGVLLINGASTTGENVVPLFFAASCYLILSMYIFHTVIKILRWPPRIIEELYRSLLEQHNIRYGTIDSVAGAASKYFRGIYYRIDGAKKTFNYVPNLKVGYYHLNSGMRVYILYLNERIHVLL